MQGGEKVPRLETSMVTANRVYEYAFWVAEVRPFALGHRAMESQIPHITIGR